MAARLRTIGIGGSIAALLASGALLFPAAQSAQAMRPQGMCEMLESEIDLALANNDVWYAAELFIRYRGLGC